MKKQNNNNKQYCIYLNFKMILLVIVVIGIIIAGTTAYATTYLINSKEVKYDNSTSGLTSTNVQDAIVELNNNATNYEEIMNRINNIKVFPVGSIYISVTDTNPSTYFGGTWEAFGTGRTLVGINTSDSDFNTIEKTGGEKTHLLTSAESGQKNLGAITSSANSRGHTHTFSGTTSSAGAHSHSLSSSLEILSTGVGVWSNRAAAGNWEVFAYISHSTGSAGAHTHTINGTTGEENQNHTHTVTISGSDATSAHNILQPYITVYMWKRIA